MNNYAGHARTYSDTSGSAVLEVFLLDASTGELVALGVDKKSIDHTWINNSVTNNANVRHTLNSSARQFVQASSELPERAAKSEVKVKVKVKVE